MENKEPKQLQKQPKNLADKYEWKHWNNINTAEIGVSVVPPPPQKQ
jgi:hypothetical protein